MMYNLDGGNISKRHSMKIICVETRKNLFFGKWRKIEEFQNVSSLNPDFPKEKE